MHTIAWFSGDFYKADAIDVVQIDSCRLAGVSSVLLMAAAGK